MCPSVSPQRIEKVGSSSSKPKFSRGEELQEMQTLSIGVVWSSLPSESIPVTTQTLRMPVVTENVSTAPLSRFSESDQLSDVELADLKESMKEIEGGKAKEFKGVDEAIRWLDQDE